MYRIKQFFNRIYNLYRWLPIIWKDQDWDDHYIFEILKFKLKNQAEYIGTKDRHVSAKRDAEKMMLCVRLIERVQEEYYGTECFSYCITEQIFTPSKEHPGSYELDIKETSNNYYDYFNKYRRIYKQVLETEKTLFRKDSMAGIALNIAHINEERAHKLLFRILEENIRGWWD